MGKRKTEKPKVTFIFTPGYEQRFTMAVIKAYEKNERRKEEEKARGAECQDT